MNNRQKSITSNFIWRFLERIGAQGVTFIVSVVLARILDPAVYGTVAIVTVFTAIMQVFVDSGMGNALIQKKDADELDFSSVFYFNLMMSALLYIAMFFVAPYIALFYEMPELTKLIRVMSLVLIIAGVKNVQQAYVSKQMLFKKFFFSTLGGTIGAAIVGIWMAGKGYGVWALVVQGLFNSLVDTIILWITVKWRPKRLFSIERLKNLFGFGWKLLASALLNTGYREVRQLIIGKIYTSDDLAFYNRGNQFPHLIVTNINTSMDSVLFPSMAKEQDDRELVRDMTRRAIKISSFLMMPLMMGLAVCAEPIVRIVLTEKWLPCVFFLRIFCFTYAFFPIHTANLNAIKAMGRSDLFLKLEIVKKLFELGLLLATMFISVEAMALSLLPATFLGQAINAWPNRKILNYGYGEQLKDLLPQMMLSCVMGGMVYGISFFHLSDWVTLLLQIPMGIAIYVSASMIFHVDSFEFLVCAAKGYFKKIDTGNARYSVDKQIMKGETDHETTENL